MDLTISDDVALLVRMHKESNPFSLLTMDENVGVMMFHCLTFFQNNIYYIEQHDAIVIAEHENDDLFCYDIYTNANCSIDDLLGILVSESTKTATLGFTPKSSDNYIIEKAYEDNTTLFVMSGKENILNNNKITFPFLSRA